MKERDNFGKFSLVIDDTYLATEVEEIGRFGRQKGRRRLAVGSWGLFES